MPPRRRRSAIRPPRPAVPRDSAAPSPSMAEAQLPPDPDRHMRRSTATEAEKRYKHAWPEMPLKPGFAHLINLSKRGSGREHARLMVYNITRVIEQGGWSDNEAKQLYEARATWQRRADGLDARYLLMGGNIRGRAPSRIAVEIRTLQTMIDVQQALKRTLADYRRCPPARDREPVACIPGSRR